MTYQAPVADIVFALKHGAGFSAALEQGLFGDLAEDTVEAVLAQAAKFATDIIAPLNTVGDRTGTPFEIASTPVSAADPDAKARRTRNTPTVPVPAASTCVLAACGAWPVTTFQSPSPTIAYMAARKA